MRRRLAFTLVELLTVVAITAVLLGLILVPIVQAFNFTRIGQAFTDSQNRGRVLVEQITREIQNSAGVRDNDGLRGTVAVVLPGFDGNNETVLLEYGKLDILKPAEGDPTARDPISGAYFNPDTGRFDPTLRAPKGDVRFPVAPGTTIRRYFVGLNRPLDNNGNPQVYYNPHVDYRRQGGNRWMLSGSGDNLVVLRVAEVEVFRNVGGVLQVNTDFFEDVNGAPRLDDPYFFALNAPGTTPLAGAALAAKQQRMRNWISRSRIVTQDFRYDGIQPLINKSSRVLITEGNVPRVLNLVQFRPTTVSNEPAEPGVANRLGDESDSSANISSDSFRTKSRNWSASVMRLFPANYDVNLIARNEYLVCRMDNRAGQRVMRTYIYDPDLDTDNDDRNGDGTDIEVFDLAAYQEQARLGRVYPATRAMLASNGRSGWLSFARAAELFSPLLPDPVSGRIVTSFGIDEFGDDDPVGSVTPRADRNLPNVLTGPELVPSNDPSLGGNFFDAAYASINKKFNKVWADNPSLQTAGLTHRFIDLRVTTQADGTAGPLAPANGFTQATIVPGSEIVIGPNQAAGPAYGQPTRYTRITRGQPGPNQYKINYTDLPEPTDYTTAFGFANPPANYTANNFSSAILQPRFKKGYVQLNSDPLVALPSGNISVFYKVQFSRPGDSVNVDYDTRESINVLLTIRNYPQSTLPNPQNVTLKGTATVRNGTR
jgi:type II secretory pathway pseudopilin PulG